MANTDLAIKIATTLDATGINKADKAIGKLQGTVKKLATGLGVALGASAITSYGKAAVKAFAADEAAAQRLATAVDNLGLSFSQAKVATFIKDLETSSNIADDVLRPAFQALLTTTGSLTKSQELLNNAIQISRASGVDLATVSQDLANGYVGITRGLKKYNTGLTQAELKSKSFSDILGIMLTRSAGAASAYLETTQYKLDALTLASNNAKETIGAGLVEAFARLAGGSETSDAVKAIDNIAKAVNGITIAIGTVVGAFTKLYKGLDFLTTFGGLLGANGSLASSLEPKASTNRSKSPAGTYARNKQQIDAEAAAAKRAKELAALTTKQIKAQKALTDQQKKQASLKKSGSVFDMEQIQRIAALKGKLSEEERTRVEAQLAILNDNDVLAQKLTKDILDAQDKTGGLYKYFLSIGDTKIANPFAFLDTWILNFQTKLNSLKFPDFSQTIKLPSMSDYSGFKAPDTPAGISGSASQFGPDTPWARAAASFGASSIPVTGGSGIGNTYNSITVNGSILTDQMLTDLIQNGLQGASLSGSPSQIGRIQGMFG